MKKNNGALSFDKRATLYLYRNAIQFIIEQYSAESTQKYHNKDIAEKIGVDAGKLSELKNEEKQEDSHHNKRKAFLEQMIKAYVLKVSHSIEIGNSNSRTFEVPHGQLPQYLPRLSDLQLASLLTKLIEHICEMKSSHQSPLSQKELAESVNANPSNLSRLKKTPKSGERYNNAQRRDCLQLLQRMINEFDITVHYGIAVEHRPPREDANLHDLAYRLSLNLIDVSTPFEEQVKPHKEIIREEYAGDLVSASTREKERFILVAGAGASYAATKKYIPLGKEAAEEIRKRIVKRIPGALIEEEIDRLRHSYRLPPDEFETKILAYSKYGRKEVIEALREICGYAYIPSLSYEIIAHMLKHRFIDSIINFNYDEVLDVAVKEELQKGDYKFIYSDAHCPSNYKTLLINDRLRQPVYFKPHGTISHRSSLRFTQEDFFSIPPEIRNTMKDLIHGKVIEQNHQQPYLALNLIVVGYCLTNFEFIELIKEYLEQRKKAKLKIWVFDVDLPLDEVEKAFTPEEWARIEILYFNLKKHGLEDYMLALWKLIEGNFKDHYKPRGIERHQLVNHIFNFSKEELEVLGKGQEEEKKKQRRTYFLSRFYVELIIALLQSDGILNAKQILEDRAGDYFHLYLEAEGPKTSLREHCRELGLKVYKDFLWDTYIMERPALFYEKEKLYDHLLGILKKRLPKRFISGLAGKDNHSRFRDLCRCIRRRNIAKITPNFVFPHNHLFSNIRQEDILNTTIGWIYRFQEAINQSGQWDIMLSISEKGRFLKKSIQEGAIEGKKVELVLSSFDTDEFLDLRKDDLNLEQYALSNALNFLPWWMHNQHMVLLMKHTGKNTGHWAEDWKMFEGFYYESRLLSRRVNPIHIRDNQEDLQLLLYIFANYWYRARHYTTSRKDEGMTQVPILPDREKIEQVIQDLLSHYSG